MKRGLRILLEASAFSTLAAGLFGPIYAIFVEDVGGDILDAGMAWFVFTMSTGLAIYLVGRWEDRLKHQENMVIFSYLVSAMGMFGYILVSNKFELLLVQLVLGISNAIGTPAYDALYSKYLDRGREASEWGLWEMTYYVITALGALFGAYIAELYGFKMLFAVMFCLALVAFLSSFGLKQMCSRKAKKSK